MPRVKKRLEPDYSNTDPFRGLPPNFPTMHSRFPAVPSGRYAEIPQVSDPTDDQQVIASALKQTKPSTEAKRAWREIARRVETAKKRPSSKVS